LNPKLKSILQFILFSAIGVFLVWLSVHNIPDKDIETTKQSFRNADYFIVALSALISIGSHIIRAWRWDAMLKPLGYRISFKNSFAAVMIGYVVNYAVPRAGELSRCGIASRYEKVPFTAALGTVITERIVDLIFLLLLFIITLIAQFSALADLTRMYLIQPISVKFHALLAHPIYVWLLGIGFAAIVVCLFMLRKKLRNLFTGKIGGILKNFADGLKSIKDVERPFLFIVQSCLIWIIYFFSLYVCFWCFEETKSLGIKPALSVLLFGTLGVIVSPGGIGAYQLIATQVFLYYGVVNSVSIAFPWIVWGAQFVAILGIGGLCFLFLPLFNRAENGVPQNT
jgi:hypothetical protein